MFDSVALKHAMLDANCSMRELAVVCGISPSSLYRRISGRVSFTRDEIYKICARLSLTPELRDAIFFADGTL